MVWKPVIQLGTCLQAEAEAVYKQSKQDKNFTSSPNHQWPKHIKAGEWFTEAYRRSENFHVTFFFVQEMFVCLIFAAWPSGEH